MNKEEIIPNAEQGVLVGKTDINGREGILAELPNGKPIRLGGGEVVINEKSSTKYCKELSDINVKGGGVEFDCDLQKVANTDRASNKMPKDEWHQENAAKGTQVERTYYEEAHRYIENAKETLKKSGLTSDGKYYYDTKYVKSAAGIAYAGAEMAAKWFIKLRGIELKGRGIEQIKDAISKIDGRAIKIVNSFYNTLHLNIYYGNETNKKIVDAAMASAEEMVNYLKPYKEIAHYDSGKHISYAEAIKLPKRGVVAMDHNNLNAAAAKIIAEKHAMRPEAVYNWAQNHVERTYYEEAHRYIENAKSTLEKSDVSSDGKYYDDEKYVKSAAGIAYAGVEQAAVWYIKLRGIEIKGSGIDAIKEALSKIDKRMLKMINYLYTGMHVDVYYRGYTKKIVIDDLMNEAESFIAYLKPFKNIAHYASGKYFKYNKKSVEQFLDDYNLPGFDVKLKFDNKPETFFTIKQSRPRLTIRVKDMKNKEWMFDITRITSVDDRKVEWVNSYAAGGMEGLVPQGKLYDQAVDKMYKKVFNETESAKEFNRIYDKKLKELAKKYNIPTQYLEL